MNSNGNEHEPEFFVALMRSKDQQLTVGAFGSTIASCMQAFQYRYPQATDCSIHPCTPQLYACREMLDVMKIARDILLPTGRIPVSVNPATNVADLAFFRRAVVCGSRVLAVGRSPASLCASLSALYQISRQDPETERIFRCVLMQNARMIDCSKQLYREACIAGHGPGSARLTLDTSGDFCQGQLVSPNETDDSPWAFAAESEDTTLEIQEIGSGYNELMYRCMKGFDEQFAWNPQMLPGCRGAAVILRCTPSLYQEILASPWYTDRTKPRVRCMTGPDGRLEHY